jgi:Xaa-Pro aminopeptidase
MLDLSIIANIPRLNEYMDKHRLSAIIVRSGVNVTYLSGVAYPGTAGRHLDLSNTERGMMLLWQRSGDPVMVVDPTVVTLTIRDSWVKRVEEYAVYSETVYSRMCQIIKELGLGHERLGFERNCVSTLHWEEIRGLLPKAEIVDCAQIMEEVRWIKTPAEIALIKRCADLLDDALHEAFSTLRPGDTEREAHARVIANCIRRGVNAGLVHGIFHSSRNDLDLYGGESERVLQKGDILRTDYVAYLKGYPGHQSRTAVMGKPTPEQRRQYELTRDIHRKTMDRCQPNILASEVHSFVVREYKKHNIEYTAPLVGHGVGAWFHQQEPMLIRARHIPLEEGMVLAVEPYRDYWHIQDIVLVRKNGPLLLSDKFQTEEMFIING